jgi:hypothetical protein
MKEEKE